MTATAPFALTERLLRRGVETGRHLGGQCSIHHRGETAVDIAFGEAAPGTPCRPDSLLQWLCCTKIVTAVAVLQQVERGGLGLHTPVHEVLPEFAVHGKQDVEVFHLLTHTAGFDGDPALGAVGGTWDDMVAAVCAAPPKPGAVAGETVDYTDLSAFLILGELVARCAGVPFDAYVRTDIFGPLGLEDSWVGMPEDVFTAYGDRIVLPCALLGGQLVAAEPLRTADVYSASAPGVGAVGPLREMGQLMAELSSLRTRRVPRSGHEAVLRPDTVATMVQVHRSNLYCERYAADPAWGLGLAVDHRLFGGARCGAGTFGHIGGSTVAVFADPSRELAVAVGTNTLDNSKRGWMRQRALLSTIYADVERL
jgi:CubicO group peptidase (beta-lactamase class C family)